VLSREYGVDLPNMQMDTLERRMADPDLPEPLRELLGIRLQASSTSVAKYRTLAKSVSSDGRLRGTLQFRGAGRTGRWAGRIFQPHNLPRPSLKQDDIDTGIECIKAGSEHLLYDNVMELLTSAVRGVIVAAPAASWSSPTCRTSRGACAPGWPAKSGSCRRSATSTPARARTSTASRTARPSQVDPSTVDKDQRQIGKVMELMLQYQGGVGAFITGAATYRIDLDVMADAALPSVPGDVLHEAEGFYDWCVEEHRPTFGLKRHVFIACDSLKRLWRRAHPRIETLWPEIEDAARAALAPARHRARGAREAEVQGRARLAAGPAAQRPQPLLPGAARRRRRLDHVHGPGPVHRQWKRLGTYGGKFLENFTQAASCDQLAECMPAIEDAGYPLVLSVHDENLTEPPDDPRFTADELARLMCADLGWNKGLPLAAAGGTRCTATGRGEAWPATDRRPGIARRWTASTARSRSPAIGCRLQPLRQHRRALAPAGRPLGAVQPAARRHARLPDQQR
jgi:DNA polymerase